MKNRTLEDSTLLSTNSELFAAIVDEDLVILNEESGQYFSLNSVAKSIWDFLSISPMPFHELRKKLMEIYQIDETKCETDSKKFLEEMITYQLIQAQN